MRTIAKIGKPVILVIACVFAVGGATAMNAGGALEGLLYFLLSGLVAALAFILLPESESETNSHARRLAARKSRYRESLHRRLQRPASIR